MRVLLAALIVVFAAMTAAHAGQAEDGAPTVPAARAVGGAADGSGDLTGCSACTLRHRSMVRTREAVRAAEAARDGCRIKGDVGADGARLYYRPGDPSYQRIGISQAAGERWFCSVDEAEAAGWRAAEP